MSVEDFVDNLSDRDKIKYIKKLEIAEKVREFATKYHRNTSGERLNFEEFISMVELYDDGPLEDKLVIKSATQTGKTDNIVIYALACAACGLNVLYVFPHRKFKDSYVQEKILKPISTSPEYKDLMKNSVANSVDQLQFGRAGGIMKFVSANVAADMVSFSADVVIIEEIDTFDIKAKQNIPKAMGRMDGSRYGFLRIISNPETGTIDDWYDRSDKRVKKVPCDKCGKCQEIDWFLNIVEETFDDDSGDLISTKPRDTEWYRGCGRDMHIKCGCEGCNGNLERLSEDGYWEKTEQSEEGIAGYHKSSMLSGISQISTLYGEYTRGLDNPTEMRAFYFRRLGLCYSGKGHNVSSTLLSNCCKKDPFTFDLQGFEAYWKYDLDEINENKKSHEELHSVMGVDVRGESIDVSIATIENTYERLIYVAKLDPITQMDYFYELFDRYNVVCGVIDAEPETVLARQIQERAPCDFWRCSTKALGSGEDREDWDVMRVTTDRNSMLDLSYGKYKRKRILLPTNFEGILNGQWVKEMQSLSRKLDETKTGKPLVAWESEKGNKVDDHARLADGYRHKAYLLSLQEELTASDITIGGRRRK